MQIILTDVQHVWRRARHQPGATLAIILLLALGMGGITTVFNPIYSTLFSPLPFPEPDQLVSIGGGIPPFSINTGRFENEEVFDVLFSNTAAYFQQQTKIRIPDTDKQLDVNALRVTEDFFKTLGVKPLIGYDSMLDENSAGIVVSHRFWRNEFSQKTDVAGSHVFVSDESQSVVFRTMPIIGIMPEGFNFPFDTDVWQWRKGGTTYANSYDNISYIGRLRPGIPYGLVEEKLKPFGNRTIVMPMGIRSSGDAPVPQSLQTYLYGDKRPMLRMLGAAALLFLALVCAGVVNLLIAQGVRRKQEIATRLIYGATRRLLVFQMIRETLPLVVTGGLAGWWFSEIAGAWIWAQMPALRSGAAGVPVKIAFWAALVMVITFIGGLVPSLYATSINLNTYLKAAGGGKRRFLSTREFLVGVQLSMALALLIGVGVLIRSMMFNIDIPVGWSSRDVAVVSVVTPRVPTPTRELAEAASVKRLELYHDIQNKMRTMPEVLAVGVLNPIPFSDEAGIRALMPTTVSKDLPTSPNIQVMGGHIPTVATSLSPDGFGILGISLVLGRSFTEADEANYLDRIRSGPVGSVSTVIINQALAESLWPGEYPLGNVFYGTNREHFEVVGVVRNFYNVPGTRDFTPMMYIPSAGTATNSKFLVKLRPNAPFQDFHSNMRRNLFSAFTLEWVEARPMSEYIKDATASQRLTLQLLAGFAVLGIIVSGLGVYATAALAAAERTKETGIRMAIGAQTWDILKLAFWRGIRAIILGLPLGLFLAWILAKALARFLVQVNIGDLFAWTASCAILLVITTVAALVPALRAIRVNPIDAMRDECP